MKRSETKIHRGAWTPSFWLDDLRFAFRSIRRHPAFSVPAILTLALGIGVGTVLFSLLHSLVLAPLPFADPERLAIVWQTDPHNESFEEGASYPDFLDWKRETTSFSSLGAVSFLELSQRRGDEPPRRVEAVAVSHDFLPTLGARPLHGRLFTEEDDRLEARRVAVLSHDAWRSQWGSDPSVVGRDLILDGRRHEVVGVLPPEIRWDGTEIWVALVPAQGQFVESRGVHNLSVIGRLRAGISPEEADLEMAAIAERLAEVYPEFNRGRGARVQPLHEAFVRNTSATLWLLFAAAGLVLLLACANVAGLLIARSDARRRELAVRSALGADRRRLGVQLGIESLVVALIGGGAGVLLAVGSFPLVLALVPSRFPGIERAELSLAALGFAAAAAVGAGLLFGLVPVLRPRPETADPTLRRGGTPGSGRGRSLLVAGEVALAFLLVAGAGLIGKSFWKLASVDPGFEPDGVLSVEIQLPDERYPMPDFSVYPEWPEVVGFYRELMPRLEILPGVRRAALANFGPTEQGFTSQISFPGRETVEGARDEVRIRAVTPDYHATVGVPLLAGRSLQATDEPGAPDVVLVNDAFVRHYLRDTDPLRERVTFWGRERRIVGVTGNVRFLGPEHPSEPALYVSLAQLPMTSVTILLFSPQPQSLIEPVRRILAELEPDVAPGEIVTLRDAVREARGTRRFQVALFSGFALLALVLAGIGLYGLLTLWVQQRWRELGVRKALGAEERGLVRMVLGQGSRLVLLGVLAGIAASLAAARALRSFLFDVEPLDPSVHALVVAVLATLALVAAWIPARRAARVDPMTALREE